MAHEAQNLFFRAVKQAHPEFFEWKNVLEVGSLDINGSVRSLFEYCNYVGVDLDLGPGVDLPVQGQELKFPNDSFDITVSAECFEHNPFWAETFENMVRMTKPGGLIVFTCAGTGRPEHGTYRTDYGSSPLTNKAGWTYYKNLEPKDFDGVISDDVWDYMFHENPIAQDLYFVGRKNGKLNKVDLESVNWNV